MAKYKIIPSLRTIVHSPISIGHKAEKGVEAIEFDVTAWVETYGSGTLTVIMRRWGDAIPYPIALEIDENNKATWVLSDTDTARAGMAYAQLSYIVGDEVVKKSDIYTFRVMDSLTGEGEPPEAYESWLEHLTHLAAEAMAEVLDIEGIVTDKTLTVDGGIADAKAAGDALALKADKSTTYTKTQVDQMIADIEVGTDTTLSVSGKPADAAETGRQIGSLKADLDIKSSIINLSERDQKLYPIADWELGTVKVEDGSLINNTLYYKYRVRTHNILHNTESIRYYVNRGYSLNVFYYDAQGVFQSWSGASGQNKYVVIPANSYYRLSISSVPEDTSIVADVLTFVCGVYAGIDSYIRTSELDDKSITEQIVAMRNIGTAGFDKVFPESIVTTNLYNPDYETKNTRIDTNNLSLASDTNYNLYRLVVPSGKTLVCTGIKNGTGGRITANTVRSNVVVDKDNNIVSANTSSATAGIYSNTSESDLIIYLNCWSDTNTNMTITDLMMRLFDNSVTSDAYITPFEPYGVIGKNEIYNGVTNILHPPRHFFSAEVERVVEKVRLAQAGVNYTFAFITDTHYTPGDADSYRYTVDTFSNVKKISELIPLDAVVHGGDFVARLWGGETQEETNAAISMIRGWMMQSNVGRNVHITPGNHEGIDGSSSPATGLYGVMMTQDNATVVRDGDSYDCYYDMVAQKLRVIMLSNAVRVNNVIGVSASGLAWLNSALASVPTGYNVMVISHISPSSADFVTNKSEVVTALNAWHNNASNGQIVAWIAGHEHFDWIVPSSVSGCDFPVIICTCSMRNARIPSETEEANGAKIVSPRNAHTVAQDAWTIFVYQPNLGKIEKIRFGLGDDETIDYANWT